MKLNKKLIFFRTFQENVFYSVLNAQTYFPITVENTTAAE